MNLKFNLSLLLLGTALGASNAPSYPAFSRPVTLKLWDWGGSDKAIIAAFEKAYPSIKVEWANVGAGPDEYNKLLTALKAGTGAPDVAAIEYGFLPTFIAFGGLQDLSRHGANAYRQLFPAWAWQQVSPDGKAVYGIPGDQGPLALVYRADLYAKYGLKVPKTWAEFQANAQKLSNATGGKVKIANFFGTYAPWYMGLVWADGGTFWTAKGDQWTQQLNSAKAKRVMSYWGALIDRKLVSTYQDFTPDFYHALDAGSVISSVEAAWGPGTFASSLSQKTAGKWKVAPLPQWPDARTFATGNWGGGSYAVTVQSKEPEAATLLAAWMQTHPKAVEINWTTQGVFPAATTGTTLASLHDLKRDPNKFFGADVAGAYLEASRHVNPNFRWAPWFLYANDAYNKHVADAISHKATWTGALDAWQQDVLNYAQSQSYTVREP